MRGWAARAPPATACPPDASLAIALGANLGDPSATFAAVRPLLAADLQAWAAQPLRLRWSPRFRTQPVGGPPGQPPYLNAVLVAWREPAVGADPGPDPPPASWPDPVRLLARLQRLEARFGRERRLHWGPRRLDLDLLWCGELRSASAGLTLPHPRLGERAFVLAPLAAVDPALPLPATAPGSTRAVAQALAALTPTPGEAPPLALAGAPGWPEGV